MTIRHALFVIVYLAAHAFFGWTIWRMVKKLRAARPVNRDLTQWPQRFGDVLMYFFLQRSVAREGLSWHHLPIFWGFLIITVGTGEIFLNGLIPGASFAFLGPTLYGVFRTTLDITNFVVLLMIVYAFWRRIFYKPRLIPLSADAALILSLIGLLCISHFVSHGLQFGAEHHIGAPGNPETMPISRWVSSWAASLSASTRMVIAETAYWVHVFILLFFLNYIPYSKHLHLLGSFPNILLRRRGQSGILPKVDLEDENQWGVGRPEQFSWKTLLDGYACTECARCSNSCPAFATGKPLSPMHVILDIKDATLNPQPELSLVGGRIKDTTLWSCTTCGACEEACPVFIEHPLAIIQMRTHLVLSEGRVPSELGRMFRGMENNGNPWGLGAEKRMDWAEGLDVPRMADKKSADYLLWIGCAGSFDPEGQKTSRALVQLLKHANVDFAVLGEEETCTGDSARRAGNEFLFQTMATSNVETFKNYGVKKVVTACPHCFHSFKNEYSQFGGEYDVVHHTQLLEELVSDGKLALTEQGNGNAVTFHDPCYLGRWNGEYDAPRELLRAAIGEAPVEMPRHRNKSFCCGAGGAQMWMEERGTRVNVNRIEEAAATGAKTVATACPYCKIMVNDGIKAINQDEQIAVKDIAQLLNERIAERSPSA